VVGVTVIAVTALALTLTLADAVPDAGPAGADPGRLTGWALPGFRLLADGAAVVTVGLLLTACFLLPSPRGELSGLALRAQRAAVVPAAIWALAAVAQGFFTISDLLAVPAQDLLGSTTWVSSLLQISQGKALLWQAGLALLVAVLVRWSWRTRTSVWTLLLAMLALAPPVLTGHAASSGAHDAAIVSLLVHVGAVSLWTGGLVALVWVAAVGSRRLPAALTRYSAMAAWTLVAVGLSGIANAVIRAGWDGLLSSAYGAIVLAKVVAIGALALVGLQHRRRVIATLETNADAGRAVSLRRPFAVLAVVELAIMAAAIGLAVALSRTPTPATGAVDPAAELLGHSLPPAPSVANVLFGLAPSGLGIALVMAMVAGYAKGVLVLHARGDSWPVGRSAAWLAGVVIVAWATFGGLGLYSHVLFSAHMVAHMLLSMVAPILLVLGAPVTLALRTLPSARVPGEYGPRQLLIGVLHSGVVRVLTHPLVAAVLFVGSLYAIYFSGLFTVLMDSHLGHAAMTVHFLAVGSLFFYVLVGVDPGPRKVQPLWRFGLLLIVMPFHAFFSIALMSTNTVLGETYWRALDRPYRTDLLADQTLGGSFSWALGEAPIILVMIAVFVQWARSDARDATRGDRAADRFSAAGRDDDMDQYNAYLAGLSAASGAAAARRGGAADS
jgi:putative copper resistance protein D